MKRMFILILSCLMITTAVTPVYAVDEWTRMQTQANQIATIARAMGLSESNPIIQEASRIWWAEFDYQQQAKAEADAEFLQSHYNDAVMMARVMFCEARGIGSKRELSMICWCILNRLDSGRFQGSIPAVITADGQFAYRKSAPMVNDFGIDLFALAQDVLLRWQAEREGEVNVGRTLPKEYCFYKGNGYHNYFQITNNGRKVLDFGLENPYES